MNALLESTTNHRRLIMFAASEVWGIFTLLVFYRGTLTYREIIISPLVGLLVFEFLFRTRKYLKIAALPLYILVIVPFSQLLYGFLYAPLLLGGWSPIDSLQFLIYGFPYNVYFLIDTSVVIGIAYYLIKVYKQEGWKIQKVQTASGVSNEPITLPEPVTPATDFSSFLNRYEQQIWGFVGWFMLAGLLATKSYGLITTPATIICLIAFGVSKTRKGLAGGILLAVSLNLVVSLVRGLRVNAWCFMPFYLDSIL